MQTMLRVLLPTCALAGWLSGCGGDDGTADDAGLDDALTTEDAAEVPPADDAGVDLPPLEDGGLDSGVDEASVEDVPAEESAAEDTAADEAAVEDVVVDEGAVCVPESNGEFCTRQSAECGELSGTDNCGDPRTVASCGDCTSPEDCRDTHRCFCDVPPDPAAVSCSADAGHNRVRFTGATIGYFYVYRNEATGIPASCGSGSVYVEGRIGANSLLLTGGPTGAECGYYRLCATADVCATDTSPGVVLRVCYDAVGSGTCTVL
jgi:hypothetical protein